ncbi:hypothetical protein [Frigidibacter sp. SD6-1]|uniref:hypothetical protein n=1 Tax=Frigidibacter sp. SD6-1 TaxID=3032581 RepID=UPI0024DF8134|nr:hypothetical protein [Frigidibacter sp. SD6-1]
MVIFLAALFGALLGIYRARARGGKGLDMAQYAAAHAILFALLGLIVMIFATRA